MTGLLIHWWDCRRAINMIRATDYKSLSTRPKTDLPEHYYCWYSANVVRAIKKTQESG